MPLQTDGAKLRELRELKNMTSSEFAGRVGYSLNHVSQVELGKRNGGPKYLRKAARVLGCRVSDITNGVVPRRRAGATIESTAASPS